VAKQSARFLLALNSPLYAPIVLAVAIGKSSNGASSSYAGRFTVSFASRQSRSVRSTDPFSEREPLLACVLEKESGAKVLTVGVCDPMRLANYSPALKNYHEPAVTGAVIDKMCFWLFDGEQESVDDKWHECFDKILVHPKGFTGYTVAAYDLLKAKKIDPEQDHRKAKKALKGKLHEVEDPDQEHVEYNRMKLSDKGKKLAYISANPLHAIAGLRLNGHNLLRSFGTNDRPDEISAGQNNIFSQAVMTGLVVPKAALSNGDGHHLQTTLPEEISDAIKLIADDPDLSAYEICKHIKATDDWEFSADAAVRYLGVASARELAHCLTFLSEQDAFNGSRDLKVGDQHIANTLDISSHVLPLLGAPMASRGRSALQSHFEYLRAGKGGPN
jgi:hypothetical protein